MAQKTTRIRTKRNSSTAIQNTPNVSTDKVQDARKVIEQKKAEETSKKSIFRKIVFSDKSTTQTSTIDQMKENDHSETKSTQRERATTSTATQTKSPGIKQKRDDEILVSRVNPAKTVKEAERHNEEPPSMTANTLLEASHEIITQGLVGTLEKATSTTKTEEETPLFRKKRQRVLGVRFITGATKKDQNLRSFVIFVKKSDWEAIKASDGPYWLNIRNRLYVREDCLLIDERS